MGDRLLRKGNVVGRCWERESKRKSRPLKLEDGVESVEKRKGEGMVGGRLLGRGSNAGDERWNMEVK